MSAGSSSASRHWRNQRLTALALVPLTFWFLAALLRQPALDHATVSGWLARPLQALLATLFGAALLWHSLQGIQVVLEDYVGGRLHTVWLTIARLLHLFGAGALGFAVIMLLRSGAA
jgi:succinate dehydrogenase / fumarate reductase membrane anchor subunit